MENNGSKVKKLTVAGTDISAFSIVFSRRNEEPETASYAAKELAAYIETAAGIRPAVIDDSDAGSLMIRYKIIVGKTAFDTGKVKKAQEKLKNNGYAILTDGGSLFLTSQTVTGALYAVYSFLEDFVGVRFYSSHFETVKPADHIDIPADVNVSFSPVVINRDTVWFDTFDPAFSVKQKINGYLRRDLTGYGEQIKYAGAFVHSLPDLAGTSHAPDVQPCLTDPEIYKKVLGNVKKQLREHPDARIVTVSQNDSYPEGRGCQCENCRKIDDREGTPMGSLLTFVNRIAGDIKDEFPGVYVDTLAYRYTRKAPKYLKPADNVIVRLCSIECCFSHTLKSGCGRNREFTDDLEEWSAICDKLFIWDYTTDFLYYVNPFPNLNVLYDNIRYFVEHSVIGLFEQGNGQSVSGEFGELRAYLIAKMMWDPYMSRERYYEYMDDFLEGYYGAGWKYVRKFIDRTSEMAEKGHMGIYYPIDKILGTDPDNAKECVKELSELWDNALALSDDVHRGNVEKSSLQIRYAALCLCWDEVSSPAEKKALYDLMKKYNITYYREGVRLPDTPDLNCPPDRW
jgi:hypothetical protein